MRDFKAILGIVVLLLFGFAAFVLCSGFGMLIGLVFLIFPLWGIMVGTLFGSVGVFLYLLEKK